MSEKICPWGSCQQIHECKGGACGVTCEGHFCAEVMV